MKLQQVVAFIGLALLWVATEPRAGVREIRSPSPPSVKQKKPKKLTDKSAVTTVTLKLPKSVHPPNEVGVVPILEYHDISPYEKYMHRSITNFRRDLNRLYTEGYRPISMKEYLDNRIDLPVGLSPVLLTFDDARQSQFSYLPNGKLDPQCAVAILQELH